MPILSTSKYSRLVEKHNGAIVRWTALPLPYLPRRLKAVQKEAMYRLGDFWLKKFGARHFHPRAYREYGSKKQEVYQKRKGVSKGFVNLGAAKHTVIAGSIVPLFRTGRLKRAFLYSALAMKATGAGRRMKTTMTWPSLPRYTYYKKPVHLWKKNPRKAPLVHDKVKELTEMSPREEQRLAKEAQVIFARLMG